MRAIAQLLMTLGNFLGLRFLVKIGSGMIQTTVVGDRISAVKRSSSKSDKDKDDKNES